MMIIYHRLEILIVQFAYLLILFLNDLHNRDVAINMKKKVRYWSFEGSRNRHCGNVLYGFRRKIHLYQKKGRERRKD